MARFVFLILIRWIVIYPVDSAIQRLNNQGQVSVCHSYEIWFDFELMINPGDAAPLIKRLYRSFI